MLMPHMQRKKRGGTFWLLTASLSALTYTGLARDWPGMLVVTTFCLIPCAFCIFLFYAFYR